MACVAERQHGRKERGTADVSMGGRREALLMSAWEEGERHC
jgi:hypothetical protein